MEEIKQGDYCASCKKVNVPDNVKNHLTPGTVLNGKYLVGNALSEGTSEIVYIGRDLVLNTKVIIRECYPSGCVTRDSASGQQISAASDSQRAALEQEKVQFRENACSLAQMNGRPESPDVAEYFEANNTAYVIMNPVDNGSQTGNNAGAIPLSQAPDRSQGLNDNNRTVLADGYNVPQQGQSSFTPPHQQQPYQQPYQQQPYQQQPGEQSKSPRKSTAVIVAVLSALVIIGAVTTLIFLLLSGSKDDGKTDGASPTVSTEATEQTGENTQAPTKITPSVVKVPACENKSYDSVKKELQTLGLKIEEKYDFSESVKKDDIIKQSPIAGSELNEGDAVTLTISKGSEKCPYYYSQKLTVTAASGASYGTATLYEWRNGDWEKQISYDCCVSTEGIGKTIESDSATPSPQGVHKLGVVLGLRENLDKINTNLNKYYADGNTCVVNDSSSPRYNQIMNKNQVPTGETIDPIGTSFTDGSTYAIIYIEHNGSGISADNVEPGAGSAIGLRGRNVPLAATSADVDISADDMIDLLGRLDANKNPVIEIKVQ